MTGYEIVEGMSQLKQITVDIKNALLQGQFDRFGELLYHACVSATAGARWMRSISPQNFWAGTADIAGVKPRFIVRELLGAARLIVYLDGLK